MLLKLYVYVWHNYHIDGILPNFPSAWVEWSDTIQKKPTTNKTREKKKKKNNSIIWNTVNCSLVRLFPHLPSTIIIHINDDNIDGDFECTSCCSFVFIFSIALQINLHGAWLCWCSLPKPISSAHYCLCMRVKVIVLRARVLVWIHQAQRESADVFEYVWLWEREKESVWVIEVRQYHFHIPN